MVDTSAIHALIARARLRLRMQAAIEGATLAAVVAFAAGLVVVFITRQGLVDVSTGLALLAAAAGIIPAGALLAAIRRVPDQIIAQRIDRASDLADRLGTACAFEGVLARPGDGGHDAETLAFMEAAVADAVRAAPRADLVAATPYRVPADWPAALVTAIIFLAIAGLGWQPTPADDLAISGNVTLDGKPLPDEPAGRGTLVLIDDADGGNELRIDLGSM